MQEIARDAGLRITKRIPIHLLENGYENGHLVFLSWLGGCRAPTLNNPLSRAQLGWFTARYATAAVGHVDIRGRLPVTRRGHFG